MGEDVAQPGERPAIERLLCVAPFRAGQSGHPAEHPAFRTPHQPHGVVALNPVGDTVTQRTLAPGRAGRERFRSPTGEGSTVGLERADDAIRRARAADRGSQVHHRLREVARVRGRRHFTGQLADAWPAFGNRSFDAVQPGDYPLNIRIDHHRAPPERDRCDCSGRIGTDSRQGAKFVFGGREAAHRRDLSGAGDEVARPSIIAEAGPLAEDFRSRRTRKCFDCRPASQEPHKSRRHRGDRGLLEHDLR